MSGKDTIQIALIADGASDEALLEPIAWALRHHKPKLALARPLFQARRPASARLIDMIEEFLGSQQADLIFVHRDAERMPSTVRRAEIPLGDRIVPIVPVRMTEAWLLIDEQAIRKAAGNPNGRVALSLPRLERLESLPNPKATLIELLTRASEFRGRRRQQFQSANAARRVAQYIDDFTPLRALHAFRDFEADLTICLQHSTL